MSDQNIDGVTVKHLGGGYYELSHESLEAPEKVRGKEDAETRAKEIAAAALPGDGSMQPQGDLPDPSLTAAPGDTVAVQNDQGATTATVVVNEAAPPPPPESPARVPGLGREFRGELDKKAKSELKKAGLEYTTIILEESDDIPPTGLFIGHNGRSYVIATGVRVDVPDFLIGVLDDAITSTPIVDSKTRKVVGYRDRLKYPYREVK